HQRRLRLRRGGSRRHLRGRTAFQADTEGLPLSGGVAPGYSQYSLPGYNPPSVSSSLPLFDSSSLCLFDSLSLPFFLSLTLPLFDSSSL
ncbi:MAG: hypothetical protein PUB84_06265, partial [Bacteroidales bacterium]|nr:hypothetical protein [Bacteroidales bacterium]